MSFRDYFEPDAYIICFTIIFDLSDLPKTKKWQVTDAALLVNCEIQGEITEKLFW